MSSFNSSFSAKMKAGWSKADMMRYYCLTEAEYNRVIESLEQIWGQNASPQTAVKFKNKGKKI